MQIDPVREVMDTPSERAAGPAASRVVHDRFGRLVLRAPEGRQVPHAHRQAELLVVLNGKAVLEVDGSHIALPAPRGVVLAPMLRHALHVRGVGTALTLALMADPGWLHATCGADPNALSGVTPMPAEAVAAAQAVATTMAGVSSARRSLDAVVATLGRLALASAVAACRAGETTKPLDRRLARTLERMPADLAARTPMESIARHHGLSRPHFFKLFQQALNLTPALYLNMLRIEHAVREIAETDRPVGLVAGDLGFTAQANFTRFFRGVEGISPSEYRRAAALSG